MSRVRFTKIATPTSPAASKGEMFYSSSLSPASPAFVDESGNICRVGGLTTKDYRFVTRTKILNGTTSYTPTSGVSALLVECIGGGGAGGGAAAGTANTNTAVGQGGGGGEYTTKWVTTLVSGSHGSIAVGAGGTVGTTGNNPGGTGGTTTFTDNSSATVLTAVGGSGGSGGATQTVLGPGTQSAGAGGTGGTGSDFAIPGAKGFFGVVVNVSASATGFFSGGGGETGKGFGQGAVGITASGAGVAGTLYGGGGSGGGDTASTTRQGGAGGNGLIVIEEYA